MQASKKLVFSCYDLATFALYDCASSANTRQPRRVVPKTSTATKISKTNKIDITLAIDHEGIRQRQNLMTTSFGECTKIQAGQSREVVATPILTEEAWRIKQLLSLRPVEERVGNDVTNTAFVLRLTWDHEARHWLILLKPTNGGKPRLFADIESAFLYVAQHYTDQQ